MQGGNLENLLFGKLFAFGGALCNIIVFIKEGLTDDPEFTISAVHLNISLHDV
jgi:hypothetical protein